jgi:hypothetical protein
VGQLSDLVRARWADNLDLKSSSVAVQCFKSIEWRDSKGSCLGHWMGTLVALLLLEVGFEARKHLYVVLP